jgi:hypothetical protein
MGKTTYAAVAAFGVLAVIAARIDPSLLLWLAGLGVVLFVVYFVGVLAFARKHPGAALLEGGELLVCMRPSVRGHMRHQEPEVQGVFAAGHSDDLHLDELAQITQERAFR